MADNRLFSTAMVVALCVGPAHAQDRNVYFGQTHVHTSWSLDAYILGNTVVLPPFHRTLRRLRFELR
jgi:hypothetical protein